MLRGILSFVILLSIFCTGIAHCSIIYVPSDFPTIQKAIDAAEEGDIIYVRPGTYRSIDFLGKAISIKSTGGSALTIIDGRQAGAVVRFEACEERSTLLDGFTIANGTGHYVAQLGMRCGGGIYCSGSSPTINDVVITTNSADYGGGVFCRRASPTIAGSALRYNSAATGKEIYLSGHIDSPSTLTIRYSEIEGGQTDLHLDPGCTINWGAGMIDADSDFLQQSRGRLDIALSSPGTISGDEGTAGFREMDFEGSSLDEKADFSRKSSGDSRLQNWNVVIMGWDGCMSENVKDLLAGNQLPNLTALAGANNERIFAMENLAVTVTKPAWTVILTGYTADQNYVLWGPHYEEVPLKRFLFGRLESHYGSNNIYSAWISSKPKPLNLSQGEPFYRIWKAYEEGYIEYVNWENPLSPEEATTVMLTVLPQAITYPRFFLFVHFKEPDASGHKFGQGSPEYLDAIRRCDDGLGELLDFLDSNHLMENTLIYVVTDHSFNRASNYHNCAPMCFLATNDTEIKRRGNLRDIALTIYHRLGIDTICFAPGFKGVDLTQPEAQW